ncbi:MAG: 2-C-methyl-D-erythritol 4-phosphate cytidylyltransferase [Methylococcaceae bacterium]|nr:2-C-methyl-D-erythritol 4-phosphate cytidylyltransferase [Methylococcaceae bacterium]
MSNQPHYWAIVPAAGVGKRMLADRPKQYLPLRGQTVLEHTLSRLLSAKIADIASAEIFTAVVVAITDTDPYWPELDVSKHPRIVTAAGGKERADSVLSGLKHIRDRAAANDWVLVHDAARPCVTPADIQALIAQLQDDPVGGILALASHDTLKQVQNGRITASVDRSRVWRALTPQMFRYQLLTDALTQTAGNPAITDEASALELLGYKPAIVEGRPDNIKITRPEDLALATFYLEQQ